MAFNINCASFLLHSDCLMYMRVAALIQWSLWSEQTGLPAERKYFVKFYHLQTRNKLSARGNMLKSIKQQGKPQVFKQHCHVLSHLNGALFPQKLTLWPSFFFSYTFFIKCVLFTAVKWCDERWITPIMEFVIFIILNNYLLRPYWWNMPTFQVQPHLNTCRVKDIMTHNHYIRPLMPPRQRISVFPHHFF